MPNKILHREGIWGEYSYSTTHSFLSSTLGEGVLSDSFLGRSIKEDRYPINK